MCSCATEGIYEIVLIHALLDGLTKLSGPQNIIVL